MTETGPDGALMTAEEALLVRLEKGVYTEAEMLAAHPGWELPYKNLVRRFVSEARPPLPRSAVIKALVLAGGHAGNALEGLAEFSAEALRVDPCGLLRGELEAEPKLTVLRRRADEVRKTPSWPRSWANFSLFLLYSLMTAWANLHLSGQPNTFLVRGRGAA